MQALEHKNGDKYNSNNILQYNGGSIDKDDIIEWIKCNDNDTGFEYLTVEQIVG